MKIALLADIHGNDIALNAVLDHIKEQGDVDAYWVLGDLATLGHAPIKVLERLKELPNTKFLRGNTDRYICSGDRPPPTREAVKEDPKLLDRILGIEANFSWTLGAVSNTGWFEWLSELPTQFSETLPDGTRVLCVHASPNMDDGTGIVQKMGTDEIIPLLADCEEDLICVGHTHIPFKINVSEKVIVNPGSISNHLDEDKRASYAIITADEKGYDAAFHRVAYDIPKVIDILEKINHPAKHFIINYLSN